MKKTYTRTRKTCRVTFSLPEEVTAKKIALCGDFNQWDTSKHLMKKRKSGAHSLTLSLPAEARYHFRYLLDGKIWENDWDADSYESNEYGTEDSVVEV